MIKLDHEQLQDQQEIDTLLDAAFGPERFNKSSQVLRDSEPALAGYSFVARSTGRVVGTVRFTRVHVHDPLFDNHANALMLGPLAVDPAVRTCGVGSRLMNHALDAVDAAGFERVLLVGDIAYYGRFGFEAMLPRVITMPGGRDAHRLLVRNAPGATPLPVLGTVEAGWVEQSAAKPVLLPAA